MLGHKSIHKTLVHHKAVEESLQIMPCNTGPREQLHCFLGWDSIGLLHTPSNYEITEVPR